eukprot:TRINITY_DN60362_c0_g2_i2.p3 TRINITY_DN60362_c0_g2~~TRINITY_DN60362_c0_g2_i2.p3  ORF type:complete len:205 (+),score=36.79 TRINITY_DN60362_c0_g2_i2:1077-1691(+)
MVSAPIGYDIEQIEEIASKYADVSDTSQLTAANGSLSKFLITCHTEEGACQLIGLTMSAGRYGKVAFTTGNVALDVKYRKEVCTELKCCSAQGPLRRKCMTAREENAPIAPDLTATKLHTQDDGKEDVMQSFLNSTPTPEHTGAQQDKGAETPTAEPGATGNVEQQNNANSAPTGGAPPQTSEMDTDKREHTNTTTGSCNNNKA